MEDTRPFFSELWRKYHFDTAKVAKRANVPEQVVVEMLRYRKVSRDVAERVLAGVTAVLNPARTTGHPKKRTTQPIYSLDNVKVRLEDESQG